MLANQYNKENQPHPPERDPNIHIEDTANSLQTNRAHSVNPSHEPNTVQPKIHHENSDKQLFAHTFSNIVRPGMSEKNSIEVI
jgi:hypothetical protein